VYELPSGKRFQSSIENPKYLYNYIKLRTGKEDREAIEAAFKAFGYNLEEASKNYNYEDFYDFNEKGCFEFIGYIEETVETEYDGEIELGDFRNFYFVDLNGNVRWLENGSKTPEWLEFNSLYPLAWEEYSSGKYIK
jgi:hypothetical protein